MGKKKPFIDKNKSQHFYLLNRSQTDEAYAREGNPSNFVLVPSINKSRTDSSVKNLNSLLGNKDHIDPLGFKNDGYDYTQHLKEIGGGVFIGKNGSQISSSSLQGKIVDEKDLSLLNLPEDVFSSGVELQRDLEAITISHELMDDDIRAALFDDVDENGEHFEELQDDFITHAMADNGEEDFDFDAHIAQLIARSENMIGKSPFKVAVGRSKVEAADSEDEEEFEEYFDEDGYEDEDDTGSGVVAPISQGNRDLIEKQFEKTYLEYEDSAIGYLSEAESEADGVIDLDGDDPLLEAALEDFIRGQEETAGLERLLLPAALPGGKDTGAVDSEEEVDDSRQVVVDFHVEYKQQQALQLDATDELLQARASSSAVDTTLEVCQEYLREVKLESEWDCETIISTYSVLENHPTVIQDERSAAGRRRVRGGGGARSSISQSSGVESIASSGGRPKPLNSSGHPAAVVLKATAGETASAKPINGRAAVKFNSTTSSTTTKALEKVDEKEKEEDSSGDEDSDSDSEVSRDEYEDGGPSKPKGFKNETSEEKRVRKSKVKEEKRIRRLQKKANKQSFRLDECRSSSSMHKNSSGSVYKY